MIALGVLYSSHLLSDDLGSDFLFFLALGEHGLHCVSLATAIIVGLVRLLDGHNNLVNHRWRLAIVVTATNKKANAFKVKRMQHIRLWMVLTDHHSYTLSVLLCQSQDKKVRCIDM